MLTVKEFKTYLNQFPDDMEMVETRYSDLRPMDITSWGLVLGINKVRNIRSSDNSQGQIEWIEHVTRPHQLSEENKRLLRNFLHFAGN